MILAIQKSEKGFTLIELMIVVAIIGTLSAVAYPNFKKYQARGRTAEAKLQLAKLYTAETGFYSDFGMYSGCLRYMGFDPDPEVSQRYYGVGIRRATVTIDATAFAESVNVGLQAASCPQSQVPTPGDGNSDPRATHYFAGKRIGNALADSSIAYTSAASWNTATCSNASNVSGEGSCLGTQADATTETFQAIAWGFIGPDNVSTATMSQYNIDSNKILEEVNPGY